MSKKSMKNVGSKLLNFVILVTVKNVNILGTDTSQLCQCILGKFWTIFKSGIILFKTFNFKCNTEINIYIYVCVCAFLKENVLYLYMYLREGLRVLIFYQFYWLVVSQQIFANIDCEAKTHLIIMMVSFGYQLDLRNT